MTFGEKLKKLMDEKDVTQKEVSSSLNIAISTLNGYANDNREPDFSTLASLARYFDVSTDYLLGIVDIPKNSSDYDDDKLQLLLHYYTRLNPKLQSLLVDEAKLLIKYNSQSSDLESIK